MEKSIIIAGFGGQGALLAGRLLAYAALSVNKQVTWLPSYGPEMRGGTAHCTVVISDEAIGSPLVRNPDYVIAMNAPSANKYLSLVKTGGLLIVNRDLLTAPVERPDIRILTMPASQLAHKAGDRHLINTVMLGALIEQTGILPLAVVEQALIAHLPERHRDLLNVNQRALHEGAIYPLTLAPAMVTATAPEKQATSRGAYA
ncbi:MAG: 2-oxoacid:ferredoxin oxidoreductase subunit gamma [Caldilinea sp. CFX5]|nr:2-oxoacid:ferredoxin oxidoreductase subunit gamma [Caldilinea sp. CFX5]